MSHDDSLAAGFGPSSATKLVKQHHLISKKMSNPMGSLHKRAISDKKSSSITGMTGGFTSMRNGPIRGANLAGFPNQRDMMHNTMAINFHNAKNSSMMAGVYHTDRTGSVYAGAANLTGQQAAVTHQNGWLQ